MGLAMLVGLASGCLEVNGGALEARWDIRNQAGGRIGCGGARDAVGLTHLQLVLKPLAGGAEPCAGDERCRFACENDENDVLLGITPFFVPDGEYEVSSEGIAAGGRALGPADGVQAPAPVVREVIWGEVTSLDVNLIVVRVPGT